MQKISDNGIAFSDNAAAPQIFSLGTPSLSAGAMTVTLNPCTVTFRNASLTTGGNVTVEVPAALSLTIPSGATLGAPNAVLQRLALLVAYNAGTPVLCVTNMAGGVNLDDQTLISPTTISGASTSATVIYSASAVSASSPFRVVGFLDSTQATAGTYATAPNVIGGGVAQIGSMTAIGQGQNWQNVTGSRALSTTYYNIYGRTIAANIYSTSASAFVPTMTINGNAMQGAYTPGGSFGGYSWVIPAGASYAYSGPTTISKWDELR